MRVRILQPTRCDGKRYKVGDTPEVDRVAAKGLIDVGAAEPFDAKAAAKAEAEAKAAAAALAQAEADAAAVQQTGETGTPPAET